MPFLFVILSCYTKVNRWFDQPTRVFYDSLWYLTSNICQNLVSLVIFSLRKNKYFFYCTGGSKRGDKDKISCLELVSFQFAQNNLFLEWAIFCVISFQIAQNYLSLSFVCVQHFIWSVIGVDVKTHMTNWLFLIWISSFLQDNKLLHHYHVHTSY